MSEQPRFEFEFPFDRAFLHRAHWRDYYWQPLLVAVLAATWIAFRHSSGGLTGGTILWVVVTLVTVLLLFGVVYWRMIERTLKDWAQHSPGGTLRYSLDDGAITCHTGTLEVRVSWDGLFRVWRYSDVWILEIVKMRSFVFPPSAAPEEAKEFILERCRAAGVRVINGRRVFP